MSVFYDKSETTDALFKDFTKALGEMEDIVKNKAGFNYKYAPLDVLMAMARPVLKKNNIGITQTATVDDGMVFIYTVVMHTSGQYVAYHPMKLPMGAKAQETGSMITYARRYALMALLNIASEDEDDDGATGGSWEDVKKPTPKPTPKPKQVEQKSFPGFSSADKVRSGLTAEQRQMLFIEVGKLRKFSPLCEYNTIRTLEENSKGLVSELSDDALDGLHKILKGCMELGPDAEPAV